MRRTFSWVLLLLIVWGINQYWPVTVHISGIIPEEDFSIRMPLKDKKRLDWFFRYACFLNLWAYTSVGSKPMSTHQYTKPWVQFQKIIKHPELKSILGNALWPPDFRELCYLLNPEQLRIKLGWETLNKYFSSFPNSRFALLTYCGNNDIVCLALVDKEKIIKIVNKHSSDFQEILQKLKMEQEDLFNNEKLYQFLKNLTSDGLIGTVLGFGRDNAHLYEKYAKMDPRERPMSTIWSDEHDAWLEQLGNKDLCLQPWDTSDLFYPLFACDPESEETRQLKQTYKGEREKIIKYYEGKDVVEATLSLLNQK